MTSALSRQEELAVSSNPRQGLLAPLVRMVIVTLLLFVVMVGFCLLLSSSMLRSFSNDSILRAYGNAGAQLQTHIERGLRFGRPLGGFVGLKEQLANTVDTVPGLDNMAVFDIDGESLISLLPVDGRFFSAVRDQDQAGQGRWIRGNEQWLQLLPLHGRGEKQEGWLLTVASATQVSLGYRNFLRQAIPLLILLGFGVCLTQAGWAGIIVAHYTEPEQRRKALRATLLAFVGGAQILFAAITFVSFSENLENATRQAADVSGRFLAHNLEYLVHKNVGLEKLTGLDAPLGHLVSRSPELSGGQILAHGATLASFGVFSDDTVSVPVVRHWPDRYQNKQRVAELVLGIDAAYLNAAKQRLLLDMVTALIVSFLLLFQLSNFIAALSFGEAENKRPTAGVQAETVVKGWQVSLPVVLSAIMFFFFFGYDIALSFVSLVAAELPGVVPFVSSALRSGLPISVEAGAAALGLVATGLLIGRMGWKMLFQLAVACAIIGATLAATAADIGVFVLARGISGFGFGMALMAGQIAVMQDASNSVSNLAGLYAAVFAGSICGSASGGMAYEMFGRYLVFLASACLLIVPLLLLPLTGQAGQAEQSRSAQTGVGLMRFMCTPAFLTPAILVSAPTAMCLTGFLYLTLPIQLQGQGIAQADIGRLFMLYGLCFVFVGPILAAMADKLPNQRLFVSATGLCAGLALASVYLFPGYWGYALAAFLTGVSQCLLSSSMMVYILSLPRPKTLDAGTIGSAYRLVERGAQVLGPMLFGAVLAGVGSGLLLLGSVFFGAAVLFFILSGRGYSKVATTGC